MKPVKKIMLLIFKPDVVNPCTTVSAIRKVDFDNKDNFLKVKDMSLGSATAKCLSDLQKKDLTSKQQIVKFYNDSVEITKSILMKILERSPLSSIVVKYPGVLIPKNYLIMTVNVKNKPAV